ncbi:MAG: chemotaxis protein CheD [Methylobacter sp.]|nr:chemotaxis protein CheD [Methylobacter sp.]MDP2427793.1 chemotaxis protein CheD [Methylobacter sp.]MDP3055006.1 chemotaxis protein CheD [Methylobacter sp.]MDP3361824.1 chemotaxis protein CheD [Methylobacter sp.]MDZ4219840.1 chemotaxis protein CheD [Methylobacter sp.]
MENLLHPLEVFLHPGDYYFADRHTRIGTVLGSCVAMTFWHPQLLVGGMCHYMLPEYSRGYRVGIQAAADGRYADMAVAMLLEEMDAVGAPHKEYQVKLFGGGSMFPGVGNGKAAALGAKNVQAARRLVLQYGFDCVAEHLGDNGHRKVVFEVWSGDVWVRHRQQALLIPESANRSLR